MVVVTLVVLAYFHGIQLVESQNSAIMQCRSSFNPQGVLDRPTRLKDLLSAKTLEQPLGMLQQGYYGGGPSGGAAETNVGDVEDALIYIYIYTHVYLLHL